MKSLYFLFIVALLPLYLYGQPRSLEQAILLASNHYAKDDSKFFLLRSNFENSYNEIEVKEMDKVFQPVYFLTDSISHKCVLISGDMRMESVLGETDRPLSESSSIPSALQDLIDLYTREYVFLQSEGEGFDVNNYKSVVAPDVSPLISTQWGQGSPFNDKCPTGCPSGCVATAMAQIMNYHRYPDYGIGQYSYTSGIRHFKLSCDFSSTNFDWQNMMNQYDNTGNPNSPQRLSVATLMYACGVSVSMDYDTKGGSGAYDVDIPYALINYFRYNENVAVLKRDYYSSNEWLTRLYSELESGRPVLYCGSDSKQGGHAFVVDGIRSSDSKVHVNWGWNGETDGYYVLSSLNPGQYRFSTNQSMIVNFTLPNIETGIHEDVFYASKFGIKGEIKERNSIAGSIIEPWCSTSCASYTDPSGIFNGVVGVGLFSGNMDFISSLSEKSFTNIHNYQELDPVINYTFTITTQGLEDGNYFIAPYAQAEQSETPTRIRTLGGKYDCVGFTVVDGLINGAPNDNNPVEPNVWDIIWEEDFENFHIPGGMSQNLLQGKGQWNSCIVLFSSSDQKPSPAHGKGYVFLESQSNILTEKRDVCQLITDEIVVRSDEKFHLSFMMRKYNKRKDSNDAMNVLIYTDENGWQLIYESSVETTSSWDNFSVALPEGLSRFKLAFEGCAGLGSTLFLDNIVISRYDTDYIMNGVLGSSYDYYEIYSSEGRRISVPQRGLNIVRMKDGSIKKLMMK